MENINASPLRQTSQSATLFCRRDVRRGVLGRMLTDLLQTRAMVKRAMKNNKNNTSLCALLDARQTALKLIANVTYGYVRTHPSRSHPFVLCPSPFSSF